MRALDLDSAWGDKCEQTLTLLSWYGKGETRYEDSRVTSMLADTTHDMTQLCRLLELVNETYEEDLLYLSSRAGQSSADPLRQDPTAWRLMMDWAEDKIGYGELDAKMCGYGSRYIHEEWKSLVDDIFAHSDPGVDHTITPSILVQHAMEAQGVTFSTAISPPLVRVAASSSTLSQGSTCGKRATRKTKRRKLDTNLFVDIAAVEEEDEEEEREGSTHHCEVLGPSGKRSYQHKIDTIIERFSGREKVSLSSPQRRSQIPHGIPVGPLKSIFIVDFYSGEFLNFMGITSFAHIIIQLLPRRLLLSILCRRDLRP